MNEIRDEHAERFIAYLTRHRDDRGVMADLRRGDSPSTASRAWPYIARWCDLSNARDRTIHQTVAASYAFHSSDTLSGSMGASLRQLALGRSDDGLKTFEVRFRRLLSCDDTAELCRHLGGIVRALKAKDIPVNYRRLFSDLRYWGERVKLAWARDYWGAPVGGEET